MSKELQKQTNQESNLPALPGLPTYASFDELAALLSSPPDKDKIFTEKYKGGSQALVISEVESSLDMIFGAMCWKTSNWKINTIGGSSEKAGQAYYEASITLEVLHPILRVWISREGATSGMCEHKTIATFASAAKALALKNAAKSLGEYFGRELNRADEKVSTLLDEATENHLHNSGIMDEIAMAETEDQLWHIRSGLPAALRTNPQVRKALNDRKAQIMKGGRNA